MENITCKTEDEVKLIIAELLNENHGAWYYEMQELGFNYRITDFQAALGISQLSRANQGIGNRLPCCRPRPRQMHFICPVGRKRTRRIGLVIGYRHAHGRTQAHDAIQGQIQTPPRIR